MRNKLFRRYYYSTIFVIIIFIVFLMITLSVFVSNYFAREKRMLLSENCKTIASSFNELSYNSSYMFGMSNVIDLMADAIDSDIFIVNPSGKTILCSCEDWEENGYCIHSKGTVSQKILDTASAGEYYEVGDLENRYAGAYYTIGQPLYESDGELAGYIFASSPASALKTLFGNLVQIFIFASAIPIIFIFLFVYAISLGLTKPLRMMSEAAKSISKGDYSKRIPISGNDEIAELAVSFNQMTDSLVQLESMRRSFIANVSHELKTPMTTISGFIDGILDGTIEKDKQEYYLNIVSSEIKRLSRLVKSLLGIAKLESGEFHANPVNFDISEAIFSVLLSFEQRIEQKHIEIQGLDDIENPEVTADKELLYQVIYNLVDNAVKFSNDGGYIKFSILHPDDKTVSIKIRNSGQGISSKDLPYVFERFYKADKSRSANKDGTGLGLYIVKTIIDLHGGTVTVTSKFGEYTEFKILLPYFGKNTNNETGDTK